MQRDKTSRKKVRAVFLCIDKYILPDEKLKIEQSFAKAGLKISFEKFN